MKANKSLPPNYAKYTIIEPSKNLKFVIVAVVSGIVVLLFSGWLIVLFTNEFRPNALDGMRFHDFLRSTADEFSLVVPPAFFPNFGLALVTVLIFHELVHGLFYWLFSSHQPKFGFQGLFPYAAAPSGIFFPRNQFLVVGLSPLMLLTVIGLPLMVIVPIAFVPFLLFFVVFNVSGSAGDLIMIIQLLRFPSDTLIEDSTSGVIIYGPERDRNEA